ncbi:MAG TPA: DUF5658 family protein [Armatimonadota bacterium]|jgi:hypothetical protein
MLDRDDTPKTRFFWSEWFRGQSFATLSVVFALLSFVDLLATLRMMPFGVKEGNALANSTLMRYGPVGMIAWKILLVALVILTMRMVDRTNPALARGVLWGGILLMAVIVLIHLALISGMAEGFGWF